MRSRSLDTRRMLAKVHRGPRSLRKSMSVPNAQSSANGRETKAGDRRVRANVSHRWRSADSNFRSSKDPNSSGQSLNVQSLRQSPRLTLKDAKRTRVTASRDRRGPMLSAAMNELEAGRS